MKHRIAIFASGNGSNAQAIIEAAQRDEIHTEVILVITDNPNAFVIERAKLLNVDFKVILPKSFAGKALYETELIHILKGKEISFIVLAGYMRLIGDVLLNAFPKRIVNIHPSLLPKYKGLYAIQQAIDNNDHDLGVSIHYVDAGMDTGEVIAQQRITIEDLNQPIENIEAEVHVVEHKLYVETLKKLFN